MITVPDINLILTLAQNGEDYDCHRSSVMERGWSLRITWHEDFVGDMSSILTTLSFVCTPAPSFTYCLFPVVNLSPD